MNLENKITEDIKAAMLNKAQDKLDALRAVKAAILLEKTKGSAHELDEQSAMQLIQRLIKQRKESAEIYLEQNRKDLADTELFQAKVISAYLPEQMSEEQLKQEIKMIIAETGAKSIQDLGKVMGIATKKLAGKAENRMIAMIVRELLS
jgi:uncharacterized protein YqeY